MNILTFDVEDWFHILDNEPTRTEHEWAGCESRLRASADRILGLLNDCRQRATFFCLGWIARRYPDVVRAIAAAGNEIGSHSDSHQLVYEQAVRLFEEDLKRSVSTLEDTLGVKVRCYRAPGFSITSDTPWAFDCLASNGIQIDCSVFPARRAHGGFSGFGTAQPALVEYGGVRLKEFPVNVFPFPGGGVVFSGGGYFRLLPYAAVRLLMARSSYVMTYFHPRDFDPEQPVLEGLPMARRFKSYVGLRTSFRKLERLIREFRFVDVGTADREVDWDAARVVRLGGNEQVARPLAGAS